MTALATIPIQVQATPLVVSMISEENRTDGRVVELWLAKQKSHHTRRAYRRAADLLLAHVGSLHGATLDQVQAFEATLTGAESSKATMLAACKSLFTFARKVGYTAFNVGQMIELPKPKNTLAERILDEADTLRMIALTPEGRDRVLLRVLYTTGARVSEITALTWGDVKPRDERRGQVTLFGKGGATRAVVIENAKTWTMLQALRNGDGDDGPVFRSRKGGAMHPCSVLRVVRKAAARAGIAGNVSPHWMRHAHASHALDAGIPVSEVQATLGHGSLVTTSRYTHARPGHSSGRGLKV